MTMYLCSSIEERESATVYRMASEMVGLLLALAIQGPFMDTESTCIKPNNTILTSTSISFLNNKDIDLNDIVIRNAPNKDNISVWDRNIYVFFALILTVIFLIGNYMLIFFVREKEGIKN